MQQGSVWFQSAHKARSGNTPRAGPVRLWTACCECVCLCVCVEHTSHISYDSSSTFFPDEAVCVCVCVIPCDCAFVLVTQCVCNDFLLSVCVCVCVCVRVCV